MVAVCCQLPVSVKFQLASAVEAARSTSMMPPSRKGSHGHESVERSRYSRSNGISNTNSHCAAAVVAATVLWPRMRVIGRKPFTKYMSWFESRATLFRLFGTISPRNCEYTRTLPSADARISQLGGEFVEALVTVVTVPVVRTLIRLA